VKSATFLKGPRTQVFRIKKIFDDKVLWKICLSVLDGDRVENTLLPPPAPACAQAILNVLFDYFSIFTCVASTSTKHFETFL